MFFVKAEAGGESEPACNIHFQKSAYVQTVSDKKPNCSLSSCSGWAKGNQLSIFISKN